MTNKSFCPLPWMSLNVRNNGDVRICCNANVSNTQGLVKTQSGNNYNLSKESLHGFRNSDLMKDVRLSMLRGEYHDSCIRCKRETESGMESRASWERDIWKHVVDEEKAKEVTSDDGSIEITENPLRYMDLRFGNLCNLKCRMCGPTDSSQWYDDNVLIWGDTYKDSGQTIKLIKGKNGKHKPDVDIYSWYENDNFWLELEKEIPTIERLYIVGGEPLLINQHYEFLQKCVDAGRAKHIVIEYNTNITNIPERAWNIWKNFQRIQIGMSVDAVGKINDYIRNPSKWYKIEENMRKLDNAEGEFKIWWAATIQVYNMVHLPDMMMWKIRQKFKRINVEVQHKPIISPHPLHSPKFLNVQVFPKESKEWITTYFDQRKKQAKVEIFEMDLTETEKETNYKYFCKILDQYVKFMNSEDHSDNLQKFWHYTNTLDRSRNEKLKDVCETTWRLLKGDEYGIQ